MAVFLKQRRTVRVERLDRRIGEFLHLIATGFSDNAIAHLCGSTIREGDQQHILWLNRWL
jgi:hypothetical protein